ncbi:peptide chain release factor N(5)-glutamine methyltransferase [bacterium endosymbiont of Pedicinus badii]|uniref:peptide chain release factor N(5)-glutamine methyltransferase n=1 Tax=bacterium endosymbiont of Pedicinus badii TaxID=1719126 RepID=UPI0018A83348|nr:peptide chain release factor N(5)-glutamine methyltransferase [bacterium endosymbiont of Pedicinus badii]
MTTILDWKKNIMLNFQKNFQERSISLLEIDMILKKVLNMTDLEIITKENLKIQKNKLKILDCAVQRRILGEPIEYILKEKNFYHLTLQTSEKVFIPRKDTELIIDIALKFFKNRKIRILDLGSGIGTISICLASKRKNWNILGVDINPYAIKLSKKNAKNLKLKNVKFLKSNWFNAIKNLIFDILISNPPYIGGKDKHLVNLKYEPKNSLISGMNGLRSIKYICKKSKKFLKKHGILIIEHGYNQSKYVQYFMKKSGFYNIRTFLDIENRERITLATKSRIFKQL